MPYDHYIHGKVTLTAFERLKMAKDVLCVLVRCANPDSIQPDHLAECAMKLTDELIARSGREDVE